MSLVLSLLGVCIAWLPGWGWLGVALGAGGASLGIWCMTDPRTGPAGLGFDVAGGIVGILTMSWGTAFQIKHMAPSLDILLFPMAPAAAFGAAGACLAGFFGAQILGRKKTRPLGIAIAAIAMGACVILGAGALTGIERGLWG